ncbi:unnamed protein product [Adineta steineri]|uniref:Uncharacterized protein n=1 Tax=Adineta steineri TaxID=433720 RepID=A0A818HKR2_9BILA|nr:unnamed protein product [Adineta steineri]CAF0900407.1 unnamed protein product [Adineta steineri]CAF3510156.1 unnamed protein product [Adineta steineri]
MDDINEENDEVKEEIITQQRTNPRRQRQQLRFSEEVVEEEEEKPSSTFKPPGRASRFLSIAQPSLQLPGVSLLRLRQLHNKSIHNRDSFSSEEITDEQLDKIPFKIEIIPDRRDDLDIIESRPKTKSSVETSAVIPSILTDQRRLEIIEEILKKLSHTNVLDEFRRANVIPYKLPKNNQMQKNVARHIEELTGSDTVMLNDHIYMKHLCKHLEEKRKKELEANFERLAFNEKHRHLSQKI